MENIKQTAVKVTNLSVIYENGVNALENVSFEVKEGEFLGTVVDVSLLSSDVYTIEKAGKKILFPAVKGVVKKVDIEGKKLIVDKAIFDEIAVD